jgi:hypothetical protein
MGRKYKQAKSLTEVFPDELKEILRRRQQLELDGSPLGHAAHKPSANLGLVGLALSGGGIRSATFGLGFIQGIARRGILRNVDYLSTVSGGGYIGACLSSLLNDPTLKNPYDPGQFPLRKEAGKPENAVLSHLRNGSNYLSPGGVLEKLRLPTLILRGILLNLMLFLPLVVFAVLLTKVVFYFDKFGYQSTLFISIAVAMLFVLIVLISPFIGRLKISWAFRNRFELLQTALMMLAIAGIAVVPLILVVDWFLLQPWGNLDGGDLTTWEFWVYGPIVVLSVLIVATASKAVSTISRKIMLYTVGILGPVTLFGIYLVLCVQFVDTPYLTSDFIADLELESSKADLKAIGMVSKLPAELGRKLHVEEGDIQRFSFERSEGKQDDDVEEMWTVTLDSQEWKIQKRSGRDDRLVIAGIHKNTPGEVREWMWLVLLIVVPGLLNRFFLDVNVTSPHGFYRDRLSKAYLIVQEPNAAGGVKNCDELKLSELNREGTAAPYHLINTALNLEGCNDPGLRGRNGDLFVFSKLYTGSERTGYCDTGSIEAVDSHLNLGTAMAISGAAAAPNMGAMTIKPLVFIMTMLNIRLGYWLPNPRRLRASHWRIGHAGPAYLFKESVGLMDDKGLHVNVSDGGHVENLGVYELLRRRCETIIAVDAEEDRSLSFSGLIQLMRNVNIDLGITITIDLEPIRKGEAHTAVGEIHYDDGETGTLLYVKSSITHDESPYLLDYAARHPDFPHQSTADQFFDEVQFEAYRALGEHVADTVAWPVT